MNEVPGGTMVRMNGEIIIPGVPNPTEEQLAAVRFSLMARLAPGTPMLPWANFSRQYEPPGDAAALPVP